MHFSNHRFYGGKLVVFPSPYGSSPDYGVKFFKVHGVYAGSKNELEANEVAKAVIEHIRYRKKESIGIVAMNLQQADLIEDCIQKLLKAESRSYKMTGMSLRPRTKTSSLRILKTSRVTNAMSSTSQLHLVRTNTA